MPGEDFFVWIDGGGSIHSRLFIYTELTGSLVFLPEDIVQALERDYDTIRAITTLREARDTTLEVLDLPQLDDDDYEDPPDESDPYDPWETNLAVNGEWPPRLATFALELMPDDLDDIGEEEDHFPTLPVLHIDPATEQAVVAIVRQRGYEVQRDDQRLRELDPLG